MVLVRLFRRFAVKELVAIEATAVYCSRPGDQMEISGSKPGQPMLYEAAYTDKKSNAAGTKCEPNGDSQD